MEGRAHLVAHKPFITDKVEKMLKIIENQLQQPTDTRGILFVKEKKYHFPICQIINHYFDKAICTSLTSDSSKAQMKKNMDLFQKGDIKLLVSTPCLEEGVDVPSCNYIICFDKLDTTKSFIQASMCSLYLKFISFKNFYLFLLLLLIILFS